MFSFRMNLILGLWLHEVYLLVEDIDVNQITTRREITNMPSALKEKHPGASRG